MWNSGRGYTPAVALPSLVQGRFTSANSRAATSNPVTIGLPNNTLTGNCLIVVVTSDNTVTSASVNDNLSSGIWGAAAVSSVGSTRRIDVFVGLNCPAGINTILVTHTAGTPTNTHYAVYEFYNIAQASALDGTSHNDSATAPNLTAGSITTTQDGDLIFCYGAQMSGAGTITHWNPGTAIPFGLLNAANLNSTVDVAPCTQFGIQSSHGAVNPDMSCTGGSGASQMVAIALKAANAGTAPAAGIRVVTVQGYNIYGATEATGPWAMQFPTRGNLVHLSWEVLPADQSNPANWVGLSGMSDTAGNSYGTNSAPVFTALDVSAGFCQQACAQNATPSLSNIVTANSDVVSSSSVSHFELYDVTGASSFDQVTTNSGKQTTASTTLPTTSTTPSSTARQLHISTCGIDAHTLSGASG